MFFTQTDGLSGNWIQIGRFPSPILHAQSAAESDIKVEDEG